MRSLQWPSVYLFAAAAGPLITGCLCVSGQMMLTLDELNINTMVRCYVLPVQYSVCVKEDSDGNPCYDN